MNTEKIYRIYALVHENCVYVGKSSGKELAPIRWRHLRGENEHTRAHFSKTVAPDLQLFHLTTVHTDHRVAYRYAISFARMFLNNGYILLNSFGVTKNALDLDPATTRLLSQLEVIPLQVWLGSEAFEDKPNALNTEQPNAEKPKTGAATENISMRVYPEEKQYFAEAAKEAGISQHQFFAMLLEQHKYRDQDSPDWSCVDYVRIFLHCYKERIETQEKEIAALKEQLKQLKQTESNTLKNREVLSRDGIAKFFQHFKPSNSEALPLSMDYYNRFLRIHPGAHEYEYPETEDFFLFRPELILQGKGRNAARFIIGTDDGGRKTLLRYYPKVYYTGLSFMNERFGLAGSLWMVRAERAKDGAMDVIFGLPLDIVCKSSAPRGEEWDSELEAVIADAIARSQQEEF